MVGGVWAALAHVVGGAVRDLWLGKEPKDFDLVSEATPEEIEDLFPKTLDVGRSFGIKLWPTLIFLRDGTEVARVVRPRSVSELRHALPALGAQSPTSSARLSSPPSGR